MNFLGKFIIIILINMSAFYLAPIIIYRFNAPTELYPLIIVALIFTALNLLIRPLLKLIFFPIALLTFGLSSFVINIGMLYALDFLRKDVTISGLIPLVLGTLFISFINLICQRLLSPKS